MANGPGRLEVGRGPAMLELLARFVGRHPRALIVLWLAVMGGLGLVGTGLEGRVAARSIYIDGSPAKRAHEIAVREFGREDILVLMLEGPRHALDRQGRALVDKLRELPRTLVLSPWNARGSIDGLRPSPGLATLLVSVGESPDGASMDAVSAVRHAIAETVRDPVTVDLAGGPAVVESLREAVAEATAIGERLAIPVLLIVLLLVCRSVLAAALPVAIGGFVAAATHGILDLFAGLVAIEAIALGLAGMLGLALGVDYSLLIVARFREEIEKHGAVEQAVSATVVRTGRAILPAGTGLVLALLTALLVIPGSFIASVVLAGVAATVLSVGSAMLFAPAVMTLLGTRLNRWALPRRRESGSLVMAWSRQLSRRPGVVLLMIFVLVLCGGWAFTLQTNLGVASLLPPDDPGRKAQEEIERRLGPGWVAPFEVMVADEGRPITTPKRLDALATFQRRVERYPGVEAMAGFASLETATNALGSVEGNLAKQERGAARLDRSLVRVQQGTGATANGFLLAANGVAELGSGTGQARSGSGRLADGLEASAAGSTRLTDGLGKASEGGGQLADATRRTSSGASLLASKVAGARKETDDALESGAPLRNALSSGERELDQAPLQTTEDNLASAWQASQRMSVGRDDPEYAALATALREATRTLTGIDPESQEGDPDAGVAAGVADARGQFDLALYLAGQQEDSQRDAAKGIDKLADASAKLDSGLRRLLEASRDLSGGIEQLSERGQRLPAGLRRLTSGAEQLLGGLGQLEGGAGTLSSRLRDGAQRSRRLTTAVGRLHDATQGQSGSGLRQQSPGLFRSGYFYLAGLDGTRPERRNQAGFLVNIAEGGSAARMLVVPENGPASDGATETGERLSADAASLARETDAEVVVGGLSPNLVEIDEALRGQAPLARLVLSLVTILILLPVTRSLALPIIAALFNLLAISATFGLLSLLFNGSLLGGPGFVDSTVIPATVVLSFGLAIDYEVFILTRIREEYVRSGSTRAAISSGLTKTAPVISGAAVIMIAVFLAYLPSSMIMLRNLGVALAIGVAIDAFVIRFVLLPATMRALGDRCWWLPDWLDRLLPGRRMVPRGAGA